MMGKWTSKKNGKKATNPAATLPETSVELFALADKYFQQGEEKAEKAEQLRKLGQMDEARKMSGLSFNDFDRYKAIRALAEKKSAEEEAAKKKAELEAAEAKKKAELEAAEAKKKAELEAAEAKRKAELEAAEVAAAEAEPVGTEVVEGEPALPSFLRVVSKDGGLTPPPEEKVGQPAKGQPKGENKGFIPLGFTGVLRLEFCDGIVVRIQII